MGEGTPVLLGAAAAASLPPARPGLRYNPHATMAPLLRNLAGAARRIVPGCITLGQAVAFNMFLGFFPLLLVPGLPEDLQHVPRPGHGTAAPRAIVLPPGSEDVVMDYLLHRGPTSESA